MSKIHGAIVNSGTRAEHRGNDPRTGLYHCPRPQEAYLYLHRQRVAKESTWARNRCEPQALHPFPHGTIRRGAHHHPWLVPQPSRRLQKGGVPAAPSGTATLLRLSPNHRFRPRPTLAVTDFRHPRLSWLDGRCVQGPGTYSPRHG